MIVSMSLGVSPGANLLMYRTRFMGRIRWSGRFREVWTWPVLRVSNIAKRELAVVSWPMPSSSPMWSPEKGAMQASVRSRILKITQAEEISQVELIQPLWNNYGTLSRVHLVGGLHASVVVKHIKIPQDPGHPRGFGGSLSRERKQRSYQVETAWYLHHNAKVTKDAPTPRCLDAFAEGGELFLLLEDLETCGFTRVRSSLSTEDIKGVLKWLASFHARFLGDTGDGLWSTGTYWHLATRPEELERIQGTRLHRFAALLDARLRCGDFPTIVHGDAKLANFLFHEDRSEVAAVDFQYVGCGAAMKAVSYFLGSCLSGAECESRESELLGLYFLELRACLPAQIDVDALEREWRSLYSVAWADFQRFMLGWSPGHRKLTDYSDSLTDKAIDQIVEELTTAAREACLAAGRFVQSSRHRPVEVGSKGFESRAADVLTEIDLKAQALILEILAPSMNRYDLGLLAEEGEHDDSRLSKHAFWTVDPLDGTQFFLEGSAGYATSVALVSQSGEVLLGAVYDPLEDRLFEAVQGRGVTLNGEMWTPGVRQSSPVRVTCFADRSLERHPDFEEYQVRFDIRFVGGAVVNSLHVLADPTSVYLKPPKPSVGGCAIWDLAAVSLMLSECGGSVSSFDAQPLSLNRPESPFFNDIGLAFGGVGVDMEAIFSSLRTIGKPQDLF